MTESQENVARIEQKASRPPGLLPKNVQTWIGCGIAVTVIAILALMPTSAPPPKPKTPPPPRQSPDDVHRRIAELEDLMRQEQRRIALEQAELIRKKQALAGQVDGSGAMPLSHPAMSQARPYSDPPRRVSQEDEIRRDEKRRDYQSLFAPVVAFTVRTDKTRPEGTPAPLQQPMPEPGTPLTNAKVKQDPFAALNESSGPVHRIFEGTWLEGAITNRLDGEFVGPVNCLITTPVYSRDGQHVLLPEGSRALGDVRAVESLGQRRLALAFHRIIMPDGYSLSLDQFKGLNQIGESGLADKINHHYLQLFGASIALGAIAGFSQANTRYSGVDVPASEAYRQGVASNLSQSALHILDRFLNVLPTITIREGHRVKIYLTSDLLVPAYEDHRMPSDL